jgi:DNA-binding transcriptional MerR regulator
MPNSTPKQHVNINEASKMSGLSPSVLRIWELRYGWPAPKRKPNGYRAYSHHQVQELKRMSELVKSGIPVSSLIFEGLPRWPAQHAHVAGPIRLPQTRAALEGGPHRALQEELLDALETRRGSPAREALQRSIWMMRPRDEVRWMLVPALVGLAELARAERPIGEAAELRELVRERGLQLLRQQRPGPDALWIVAANEDSHALAVVVALLLNQRGQAARYWYGADVPTEGPLILVGDGDAELGHVGERLMAKVPALGDHEHPGLVELATSEQPPWRTAV